MRGLFKLPLRYLLEKLKVYEYIKPGNIRDSMSLTSEISIENSDIVKIPFENWQVPLAVHPFSKIKLISVSVDLRQLTIVLLVEKVILIVNPKSLKALNKQQWQQDKFRKLAEWESKQAELSQSGLDDWSQTLVNLVTAKLTVRLRNLSLCYQDNEKIKILGYPCLLVVKIEKVTVKRVEATTLKFKAKFTNVSVVVAADPLEAAASQSTKVFYKKLKLTERHYLVKPFAFELECSLNTPDSPGHVLHQIFINVRNRVEFAINEYQRFFLEGLVNHLATKPLKLKYASLRPPAPIKGNRTSWWHYIISAARQDRRPPLLAMLSIFKQKIKYKELYKRKQQVVFNPRSVELVEAEVRTLQELEEALSFEDIIQCRTEAIAEIRNEVSNTYVDLFVDNSQSKDDFDQYMKECYSALVEELAANSAEPHALNESVTEVQAVAHRVAVGASIPGISVFLQSFEAANDPVQHCATCLLTDPGGEYEEAKEEFNNKEHSGKHATISRAGLLPTGKMQEVLMEFGDDIYTVAAFDRKYPSFQRSLVRERTLLMLDLEQLTGEVLLKSNGGVHMSRELRIEGVHVFDPASYLQYRSHAEAAGFHVDDDTFTWMVTRSKHSKLFAVLRCFVSERHLVPEFEFLVHYLEYEKQQSFCDCGKFTRTVRAVYDLALKHPSDIAKNHPAFWESLDKPDTEYKVKRTYQHISDYFNQAVLPNFISRSIRFILEELDYAPAAQNPVTVHFKLKREQYLNRSFYRGGIQVQASPVTALLTNQGIEGLINWLTCPRPKDALPKPFFKKNFLKTVESTSTELLTLKHILGKWNPSTNFKPFTYHPQAEIELSVNVAQVRIELADTKNKLIYTVTPIMCLSLDQLTCCFANNVDCSPGQQIEGPELYQHFKASIAEVSFTVLDRLIFATSVDCVFQFSRIEDHPMFPNAAIGIRLPLVTVAVTQELTLLLNFIAGIQPVTRLPQEQYAHQIEIPGFYQMNEGFIHNEKRELNRILVQRFQASHEDSGAAKESCLHCCLLSTKLLCCVSVEIQNVELTMQDAAEIFMKVSIPQIAILCKAKLFALEVYASIAEICCRNDLNEEILLRPVSHSLGFTRQSIDSTPVDPLLVKLLPSFASFLDLRWAATYKKLTNTDILLEQCWRRSEITRMGSRIDKRRGTMRPVHPRRKENGLESIVNEECLSVSIEEIGAQFELSPQSKLVRGVLLVQQILGLVVTSKPPKKAWLVTRLETFACKFKLANVQLRVTTGDQQSVLSVQDIALNIKQPTYTQDRTEELLTIERLTKLRIRRADVYFFKLFHCFVEKVIVNVSNTVHGSSKELPHGTLFTRLCEDLQVALQTGRLKVKDSVRNIRVFQPLNWVNSPSSSLIWLTMRKRNHVDLNIGTEPFQVVISDSTLRDLIQQLMSLECKLAPIQPNELVQKPVFAHRTSPRELVALVTLFTHVSVVLMFDTTPFLEITLERLLLFRGVTAAAMKACQGLTSLQMLMKRDSLASELDPEDPRLHFIALSLSLKPMYDLLHSELVRKGTNYGYELSVDLRTERVELQIQGVRAVFLSTMVDELVAFVKHIKEAIPKPPGKLPTPVNLLITVTRSQLIIPNGRNGEDWLLVDANQVDVWTSLETVRWALPKPLTPENYRLVDKNDVWLDEYELPQAVLCDVVNVTLVSAIARLLAGGKCKPLGKAAHAKIVAKVPYTSEPFRDGVWKRDSWVGINLDDANLDCSLNTIDKLELLLKANLDEEPLLIPKLFKWNKTDLLFQMTNSSVGIDSLTQHGSSRRVIEEDAGVRSFEEPSPGLRTQVRRRPTKRFTMQPTNKEFLS